MKTSRIAAAVLVAFLSSSLPRSALAQDDPVTMQARARFREGVDFYDKGAYENARLAFLQAYALKKHPAVLLNLAQSSAKAGHPLEAAKYFEQFLKESTSASQQQRADAENGLKDVRTKLGRIDVVAPAGTEITLDEKERLGVTPLGEPIDVEPGSHALRSSSETVRVTANAGQKVQAKFGSTVAIAPVPVPAPPPAAPAAPASPPNESSAANSAADVPEGNEPGTRHTNFFSSPANMAPVYIGLVVAGAGLAGTIVFAAFKSDAQSKADSVANEIRDNAGSRSKGICSSTDPADVNRFGGACATLKKNNDKVDTDAAIANVSAVIMVAGALTAAGWYLFAPKEDERRSGKAKVSHPTITPYAGYGNGGVLVSGSF